MTFIMEALAKSAAVSFVTVVLCLVVLDILARRFAVSPVSAISRALVPDATAAAANTATPTNAAGAAA